MEREIVDLIYYSKQILIMIEQGYTLKDDMFLECKRRLENALNKANYAEYEEAFSYYYSAWCE